MAKGEKILDQEIPLIFQGKLFLGAFKGIKFPAVQNAGS